MGTRRKWLPDSHTITLDYLPWRRAAGHSTETLTTTEKEHFINPDLFLKGQKHFQLTAFPGGPPLGILFGLLSRRCALG